MDPRRRLGAAFFSVLLAACGGTTIAAQGTSGTGGDTGSGGAAAADGGCVDPTVGQPCAEGEIACQPANPCCIGYEWGCDPTSHTWQQEGLGCACQAATPFACGTTTCQEGSYCEDHPPGIVTADGGTPPDFFACAPIPSSCLAAPSCACIGASIPAGDPCSPQNAGATCAEDGQGHVTLHCLGE